MSARRCLALGMVVGLLGLGGCSSSDKGVDPGPVEELLATAVIGSGGGSLTGGMATVIVPPGAFSGDVEMEIYLTQDANPFAGVGESPLYRVDGLPASFSQPLEVRFPVSPGETGALVAMGEENFSTSVNGFVTGFRMLATAVADTVATGTVPAAPDPVSGVQAGLPIWFVRVSDYLVDDDSAASGSAAAMNAGSAALAAVSHFSIAYPKGKAAEAALMRGYLEAAYTTFTGWPFSFARRTSWPVSVTLMDLPPDVYGYFVPSRMGDNFGSLEFNLSKLADPAEAKATAAHELLHLGQALHDNSNRWTKARTASDRYWLDEACAVWCEKEASGNAGYRSTVAAGHQMKPFEQFHVPADGTRPDHHGYGMAPLLEYLTKRQGKEVIGKIYEYIFDNDNDPVAAVNSVQSDVFIVWHPRFQRELVQGDLTQEVSLADAISAGSGTWQVKTASDTKKSFTAEYVEGAARFYFIKPTRTDFSPVAVLELTLDNTADGLLNVYKYKGASLERLGIAAGSFQVTDLDELVSDGWYLMVMVTDSHLSSPYTAKHSMTLSLEVKNPTGFTMGWANIAGEGTYDVEHTNPDSTWYEELAYFTSWAGGLPGMAYVAGETYGNTFTSIFSGSYAGANYTGNLSVTVDRADDPKQVVSFSYTTTISQSDGWSTLREYRCSGGGVSLTTSKNGEYTFTIDSSSASGAVDEINETDTFINANYSRVGTLTDTAINYVTIRLQR